MNIYSMHLPLIIPSFLICFLLINADDPTIEILVVNIPSGDMDRYLLLDDQIWTSFLKQQNGFLNKHNLLSTHTSSNNASEVYHIIEWSSYKQWKAIPIDQLTKISNEFIQSLGYTPSMKSLPDSDGFHIIHV